MSAARRTLLAAGAAALLVPAAASAAPTVTASAVPGPPQDCQAGCIGSIEVACTATDALSVETTVRCWTQSYNVLSSTQSLPTAFVRARLYSGLLGSYTLCVEGIARYRTGGTASSGVRCAPADDLGTALVVG